MLLSRRLRKGSDLGQGGAIGRSYVVAEHRELLSAKVLFRRQLSPDVVLLRFGLDAGARMSWRPGQYLELGTRPDPGAHVPYSIACAQRPERPGEFELVASMVGGRELVDELSVGPRVFVTRPRGLFVWESTGGSTVLVGIGTGLAPLRAMLEACLATTPAAPVTLLFGARTEADLLFDQEFRDLAEQHPTFSYQPTLSRGTPIWTGRRGRVQAHLSDVAERLPKPSAYLCGSRSMVADCVNTLVSELKIDPVRIKSEAH
jgi:CDP-4-dehydro-6-deoxyglucose reductase, E3